MRNVKKVIAGILLTATVLGTGTQISVGATKYNLEGSPSEVNFNKRPAKIKNKFDGKSYSYSESSLLDKIYNEMDLLLAMYDTAMCEYYINPYKTYTGDEGITIDACEEMWNDVANKCDEVLSYYNGSYKIGAFQCCDLIKQIANATIAWIRTEKEPTAENWNNVALEFERVDNSIKGAEEGVYRVVDFGGDVFAQAKVNTAKAYAAFVELNNAINPTEEDYNRVGSLLANAAIKNYKEGEAIDDYCEENEIYDGLAEECNGKFEEIYKKVKDMKQEEQNSELLADFTLMKNQIRFTKTKELCFYAGKCKLEKRRQLLNEAKDTYEELYYDFNDFAREEERDKCIEEIHHIESGYYG